MRRSSRFPPKAKNGGHEPSSNSWILILPEKKDREDEDDYFITLPSPKTGQRFKYLIRESEGEIFEVKKFNEQPRSWFIDNHVVQDGGLFLVSRIDPLFLVLPFLKTTSTKFMALDHILRESSDEHIMKLSQCICNEDLELLSDVKGEGDLVVCKLNNEKVISWLQTKVYQTKDELEKLKICTSGAQSSTYVRSTKSRVCTEDDYLRYAFGLISDYTSEYWKEKLKECLGINDEIMPSPEEPACKKVKLDEHAAKEPDEDYSKYLAKRKKVDKVSCVKLTAAERSLAKVNTKGMKNISSFFAAPKKSN